jgi:2-polyprenyl-6-methoxyphenol hydroxylase-like FAD-dependent oxidoreductase
MLVLSGHAAEGMGYLDEALAAVCAGEVQDLSVVEGTFCGLFHTCERTHDVTRAEQWLRAADDLVRRRRLVAIAGYCRAHYGGILTAAGRWPEAEAELTAAALVAIPTHDDLTCVVVAWPIDEFEANKRDIEGNYMKAFEVEPGFAERIRLGTRETRLVGTHMHNFYRRPYGAGWALVGDAGYHKDACTAQGISDGFRDAELLSTALDAAFTGKLPYQTALAAYQHTRDETTLPMYELTLKFASFEPPPPEMEQLLGAIHGNPQATEDFISMQAGTMPVQDFFDPANLNRYLAAAA